ncbi:hypothetical protein NLX86_33110 [Streptomyces sp. A3M-1-3]|uniref:BTAD domain-containing putative transcriptional regulator n=1 Tax=Streptomyces sp. A3M-1-3 TaxID=2962044 RepID=UPI0020B6C099|nr:BTAD domain-containing putative transcriptional regulator [Streptomyces sp. A3M-1-3]MCP3822749.1 hypothetical protein [Streptomyces sp. A3M-1-3]
MDEAGRPLPLGGIRQRATLGLLLLQANRVIATSQLVRALWSVDDAPVSARKILQNAVWGLRGVLTAAAASPDAPALLTQAPGYRLRVDPDQVDLQRFRRTVEEGRRNLTEGDPEAAATHLREAMSLWRGPALADLVEAGTDWPELAALDRARLDAMEDYVEAELACGRHQAILSDLQAMVEAERLRERSCALLMRALYRCGRQADALAVYDRTRTALVEDLGLEPGPELRSLQHAILSHDPSLTTIGMPQRGARMAGLRGVGADHQPAWPVVLTPAVQTGSGAAGHGPLHVRPAEGAPVVQRQWPAAQMSQVPRRQAAQRSGGTEGVRGTPAGTAAPVVRPQRSATTERAPVSLALIRTRLAGKTDEHVDCEELDSELQAVALTVREEVENFGGTVVTSIGSLFLCLFGVDGRREGMAERAVRAAQAVRDTLGPAAERADHFAGAFAHGLVPRVAVTTGVAVVGFDPDSRRTPSLVGGGLLDTGQLLLSRVPPGEVWVCERTRDATGAAAHYQLVRDTPGQWLLRGARDGQHGPHAQPPASYYGVLPGTPAPAVHRLVGVGEPAGLLSGLDSPAVPERAARTGVTPGPGPLTGDTTGEAPDARRRFLVVAGGCSELLSPRTGWAASAPRYDHSRPVLGPGH